MTSSAKKRDKVKTAIDRLQAFEPQEGVICRGQRQEGLYLCRQALLHALLLPTPQKLHGQGRVVVYECKGGRKAETAKEQGL